MAGHGRGKKENNNKNHQAHEAWMKRKKLGRPETKTACAARLAAEAKVAAVGAA